MVICLEQVLRLCGHDPSQRALCCIQDAGNTQNMLISAGFDPVFLFKLIIPTNLMKECLKLPVKLRHERRLKGRASYVIITIHFITDNYPKRSTVP